jgi:hypothetical protein
MLKRLAMNCMLRKKALTALTLWIKPKRYSVKHGKSMTSIKRDSLTSMKVIPYFRTCCRKSDSIGEDCDENI